MRDTVGVSRHFAFAVFCIVGSVTVTVALSSVLGWAISWMLGWEFALPIDVAVL